MKTGFQVLRAYYDDLPNPKDNDITPQEIKQAKQDGFLFDMPAPLSHDETLEQLRLEVNRIDPQDVANAFVYSLSTRQLQYRSALGSYWYAKAIPEHSHSENQCCHFCNWLPWSTNIYWNEYNIFNFERYKWGGVNHLSPKYNLFDLREFQKLPKVTPVEEDWRILYAILDAIGELEPQKKAGALRQLLTKKKLLKSNKDELDILLGILGICGILTSAECPNYCDCFVNVYRRAPLEHTNDLYYPLNRWRAGDGINEDWFLRVFGRHYRKV